MKRMTEPTALAAGNARTVRSKPAASAVGSLALLAAIVLLDSELPAQDLLNPTTKFLNQYCIDCHGEGASEGDFELTSLATDLSERANFEAWQLVHDRIAGGEMPPADSEQPTKAEIDKALAPVKEKLEEAGRAQQAAGGRVTARRLNAIEFETTLSDLLQTPLDIADLLPADATSEGFATVGAALNISSVQMEAYLEAIDAAIDQAVRFTERPETQKFRLSLLNNNGYMQVYRAQHPALPVIDGMVLYATEAMSYHHALWGQYVVPRTGIYRIKVSAYTVHSDEPIALTLRAGGDGHKESLKEKHRLLEHLEIASDQPEVHQWEGELNRGHFLHLYPSELPIKRFVKKKNFEYSQLKWKGPGVCVQWMEIEGPIVASWPPPGERVLFGDVKTTKIEGAANPDPNEQLHSPPVIPADPIYLPKDWPKDKTKKWKLLAGPLNEAAKFVSQDYSKRRSDAIREITSGRRSGADPLPDYTSAPYSLPIGSPLPTYGGEPTYKNVSHPGDVVRTRQLTPVDAKADADRLIRRILPLAFRRPVPKSEADRFVNLVHGWINEGVTFESAMRTGYKAVFASPQFLFHQSTLPNIREPTALAAGVGSNGEEPAASAVGSQDSSCDEFALAERLAYFLWCTAPDKELYELAGPGRLSQPQVLREQTERMLRDKRSQRFVEGFLGQWLDLHEIDFTTPDTHLYPEYDAVLHWSMLAESHAFFRHLLEENLPAHNLIESDFVTINRRLAKHYQVTGVAGMKPTVIKVPSDSVRGGVMTQASVLKVTANGTNTSPVVRGVWVLERILGTPPPPPPPGIPAVEPDIRGAVTIRDQLEKHRSDTACASCHAKIDPPGVALESFDPVGRFRTNYRIIDPEKADLKKSDASLRYNEGLPVDPAYELIGGQRFNDIRDLKRIYATDEQQIARTLVDRLLVYSTGATTTFADRSSIEAIVEEAKADNFGVRSLLHAVVQSDLFRAR